MLKLAGNLVLDKAAIKAPNLCDRFEEEDLKRIGTECQEGFNEDVNSRLHWMRRNEAGMDLALQIQKDKSFPWPGCSAVAFPLVTIAALQFHARAYPAIIPGADVVKCRVIGEDPSGAKAAQASRIETKMSYQCMEQDVSWEEQYDRLLLNVSIIGTAFKKSYFSAGMNHNLSEMVMAKDLVINYWAKSVECCGRKTQIIRMSRNEIHERVLRGTFRDVLDSAWYNSDPAPRNDQQRLKSDNRQGVKPPATDSQTDFTFGEQHVNLDLDGDGYAEPYIITFELVTGEVLRIVTRFERELDIERVESGKYKGKIIKINATEYFTKFSFIPSPDGGIYDIGFGVFLGPLNEAVNSLVNQLIDSGTMANTAGGFLARGAKIRGGIYQFSMFGWNRVDSTGDDLRKSIFPLPVREPSMVLFQLLSLLIQYTNRIAGTTDTMVGESTGQNTPASTTQTMVEMGGKIYTAIFKRIWRSGKEEFKKLYKLNAVHLPEEERQDFLGNPDTVIPSADPNITSDSLKFAQAQAIKQAAMTTPGYNMQEVERRYLKALHVDGLDTLYQPDKAAPPAPDVKLQIAQMKYHEKELEFEFKKQSFALTLMEDRRLNQAKIIELLAQAEKEKAEAGSVITTQQIAAFNAQIGALKLHSDHLNTQIELLLQGIANGNEQAAGKALDGTGGAMAGMASPSDDQGSAPMGQPGAASPDGTMGLGGIQ